MHVPQLKSRFSLFLICLYPFLLSTAVSLIPSDYCPYSDTIHFIKWSAKCLFLCFVSRTGSASDWCALQEVLCIDAFGTKSELERWIQLFSYNTIVHLQVDSVHLFIYLGIHLLCLFHLFIYFYFHLVSLSSVKSLSSSFHSFLLSILHQISFMY